MNAILSFISGLVTGAVIMVGVSVYFTKWAFKHPDKIFRMLMSRGKKKSANNGGLPQSVFGPMVLISPDDKRDAG